MLCFRLIFYLIGTEELAHLEMIGSIVYQLSDDIDYETIKKSGFDSYYVDHGTGIYPSNATGIPWSAATIQSTSDPRTNLYEDMAAEQKALSTYEYLLNLTDDPDVIDPLRFLREREIVHFQRFGECLENLEDYLSHKHTFIMPKTDSSNNKCSCKKNCSKEN